MTEEFQANNKTHWPSARDGLPQNIIKTVATQKEYDEIFNSSFDQPDFTKDRYVIYAFTDIYYGFDCELYDIEEKDGALNITLNHKMAEHVPGGAIPPSTSLPTQTYLVVKVSDRTNKDITLKLIYDV